VLLKEFPAKVNEKAERSSPQKGTKSESQLVSVGFDFDFPEPDPSYCY